MSAHQRVIINCMEGYQVYNETNTRKETIVMYWAYHDEIKHPFFKLLFSLGLS